MKTEMNAELQMDAVKKKLDCVHKPKKTWFVRTYMPLNIDDRTNH